MTNNGKRRDLRVRRVFDAPVERVWKAWTEAEQVMRWWGPTGYTAPVARMDCREGGTSLVCMRSPEGHDMYTTWAYRNVVPMRRLEYVFNISDEAGRRVAPSELGLPPDFPEDVRHVITLEAMDDRTELTVTEFGYRSDVFFDLSRAGLEQCLDKLAACLAAPPE